MSLLSSNLVAFEAVVSCKTVHGAANEIGLTQTGVTQRLRTLEKELGVTLFIRSRRGMILTREGEALHRYCKAAIDLEGGTLSEIIGGGKEVETSLSLTGPTSLMSSRIVGQCLAISKKFPKLLFNFNVNDLLNRVEKLRSGQVQMAILPPEVVAKEMDSKLLRQEKYILVGSKDWEGRKIKEIISNERIIDFDETDDTTFSYLKQHNLIDLVSSSRHFVNENEALIKMFASGVGYGTLNTEIAQPLLDEGKLIALNGTKYYEQKHALVWYPRTQMAEYFKEIIKVIK